jgi:glucokinase
MSPPRGRLVGGLDLGGTKIQAVLLDGRRSVVAETRRPTPREGGPQDVVAALADTLTEACSEAGVDTRDLTGVGVGSPGVIGGGIVLDGKTWEGRGAAAELGHVVVKIGGARCTCGRRGCLEAYAGRGSMEIRARHLHRRGHKTELFKIMEKRGRTRLQSGVWARALEQGDAMAVELIDRAVEALGAGVGSAVNLLDVETVVIGGGLGTRLGEPYVERIREAMMPHLFADERPPAVRLAALGDLGGAIGAALLVPRTAAARDI